MVSEQTSHLNPYFLKSHIFKVFSAPHSGQIKVTLFELPTVIYPASSWFLNNFAKSGITSLTVLNPFIAILLLQAKHLPFDVLNTLNSCS